ncbi:amidase [bacterium]|nr:amidase [bacterium]MDB2392489.1 amidase family protein [Acidimicrobiaceae bacterium]
MRTTVVICGVIGSMVELTSSLTTLIAALDNKDVSARELLAMHLDRVDELDGAINSVVTLAPERAEVEAAQIDQARASGEQVGQLAGVPITIKDALATEGIRSTGGAVELSDFVPDTDAVVVDTVRTAGAVVFGKTNIPRWSGDYQSYNELFGTTNNPWDITRTPGGSSGGPAAAVAMGFTGFEIGTDIGGSIRLPSSHCGVYGHKPSFGVIPTYGYLDSVKYHRNVADVNVFGPIARSINDLDLLVDLLAGPNPDDAPGWRLELPPPRATELADFRVAAWLDDSFCPVDASITAVLERAVGALENAGARIDHDVRPALEPLTASVDGSNLIGAATDISGEQEGMSHLMWDTMHRQRGQLRQRWTEFFGNVDVLLCPVSPTPAFQHVHSPQGSNWAHAVLSEFDDMPYRHLLRWNTLIGSAYLPVTVPPVGRTPGGLPVGIQVVAPFLHDRTALAFARCISEVIGGYEAPPMASPDSSISLIR